jgi:hypothetical protein
MDDKYKIMDEIALFGFFANALGGGGDKGQSFPRSDAEDLSRGLRYIPGEVTEARRNGDLVLFEQPCTHPCCWYWQFQDKSKFYYWQRDDYEQIAITNGKEQDETGQYPDVAGPCPDCGNKHTSGGKVQ